MVRIEHYSEDRIADPEGNVSWWDFHVARNAVVRACRLHGTVGPFGELPLEQIGEDGEWLSLWERGDENAAYYVIDDQYNSERYQYLECTDPAYFTEAWIRDLMAALRDLPGWGVGIKSVPQGYILVFAHKIMATGKYLVEANDLPSLINGVHEAIRNKDKDAPPWRSGDCTAYSFERDQLVCEVAYTSDDGTQMAEQLQLGTIDVWKVWRNPFTGDGMMTLKSRQMIELPDDAAFQAINDWFVTAK